MSAASERKALEGGVADLQEYVADTIKTRDRARIQTLEAKVAELVTGHNSNLERIERLEAAVVGLAGKPSRQQPIMDIL